MVRKSTGGIYVYGLAYPPAKDSSPPEICGIDEKNPIYFIQYRKIGAFASRVPWAEFGQEALEKNLSDINWVRTKAEIHHHIITKLWERGTILPLRFGTIYQNNKRVRQVIGENYWEFSLRLNSLKGKEEWGLKIFRNLVQPEISLGAEENLSPGKAFFLRKHRAKVWQEEMEEQTTAWAEQCFSKLKLIASSAVINKVEPGEMILNVAFLVDRGKVEEFRDKVEELQGLYLGRGLKLQLTGPWPPYSF